MQGGENGGTLVWHGFAFGIGAGLMKTSIEIQSSVMFDIEDLRCEVFAKYCFCGCAGESDLPISWAYAAQFQKMSDMSIFMSNHVCFE